VVSTGASDARDAWNALSEPWQICLDEAWQSWRDGSAGVGAAIVDPRGRVVARGRNRRDDPRGPEGALWGTRLAHAEMCALAALPAGFPTSSCELYTTFEPCLMCAAAIMMAHVPRVHFAAADPLFDGMHDWLRELRWASDRMPERSSLGGPIGAFAHVLHLSWLVFWLADSPSLAPHGEVAAAHLALASTIASGSPLAEIAARRGDVTDAIAALWDDLLALPALGAAQDATA